MPTPNEGESENEYVSRCIPIVIHEGTAKDSKQAAAICHSMWDEHKKKGNAVSGSTRVLLHLCAPIFLRKDANMNVLSSDDMERSTILVGDKIYNDIFFPSEELEKSFMSWDKQPLNINHSENIEDIVGYVVEPKYDKETKKFSVKPVLDESTSKYAIAKGYIESRMKAGAIPEVSIGVWCDTVPVKDKREDGALFVASNLIGDHLALVTRGACGPKDGCGIGLDSWSYTVDNVSNGFITATNMVYEPEIVSTTTMVYEPEEIITGNDDEKDKEKIEKLKVMIEIEKEKKKCLMK